jgi:hypothetical protein
VAKRRAAPVAPSITERLEAAKAAEAGGRLSALRQAELRRQAREARAQPGWRTIGEILEDLEAPRR